MMDSNNVVVIEADVLVRVFLELLNKEELINNQTYLAAVEKLGKGDEKYVNIK